jgi:BirA family biotin operon repressor/biotin-[acetyl-CoA-carboxylase] ligase
VAVAATVDQVARPPGRGAWIKWPNDVLVDGRKVAGILVEGRPQEDWAVLGIGLNVAVSVSELPPELRDSAGTLGLEPTATESVLAEMLLQLERWRAAPVRAVLEALRPRDALRGHEVGWEGGSGVATGIDGEGRLLIDTERGRVALDAGEVHLSA